MVEAELIVANLPAMHEQKEALGAWWNASHHSQNFRDVRAAAKDTFMSSSLLTKALTVPFGVGLVGLETYELSWKNENKIAEIATERYIESGGGIAEPMRGVFEFTGKLEIGIGLLTVAALHTLKPAMDVVRKRYFAEHDNADHQEVENEPKSFVRKALKPFAKMGRIWGIAIPTGALGVTTIEDASRGEYSAAKNAATAVTAAGMLAVNNAVLAGTVIVGMKSGIPYLADGARNFAEIVKSPLGMGSVLGGLALRRGQKERKRIYEKWEQEELDAARFSEELEPTA